MSTIRLYNYWRSSASYRVRIALGLKGLAFEYVPVHLVKKEQQTGEHHARNPMEQIPAIELEIGGQKRIVAQSIAILELLEELHPSPALLPKDAFLRARTRELAELVNAGIQPHQNMSPLARLDAIQKGAGREHAIFHNVAGLSAFEERVKETAGKYCVGDAPTFADCCLVPQLYSARRFEIDVAGKFPTLTRIDAALAELPGVAAAHPDRQPDANS
ncbi:MAG: maleylacetoacetate isomerase [Sandaracinus sp.]